MACVGRLCVCERWRQWRSPSPARRTHRSAPLTARAWPPSFSPTTTSASMKGCSDAANKHSPSSTKPSIAHGAAPPKEALPTCGAALASIAINWQLRPQRRPSRHNTDQKKQNSYSRMVLAIQRTLNKCSVTPKLQLRKDPRSSEPLLRLLHLLHLHLGLVTTGLRRDKPYYPFTKTPKKTKAALIYVVKIPLRSLSLSLPSCMFRGRPTKLLLNKAHAWLNVSRRFNNESEGRKGPA